MPQTALVHSDAKRLQKYLQEVKQNGGRIRRALVQRGRALERPAAPHPPGPGRQGARRSPPLSRGGRAGLVPATWRRDCRRRGSAFVARPEPGDVAGGCADSVVLRLEPGVLAEPGDVKSGAWPAGAGREVELGLGHCFPGCGEQLYVRGHPPGRDVVGAVLEMPGELDQGYRTAGVLDVAQVEPVAEVRRDEQGGQVQG